VTKLINGKKNIQFAPGSTLALGANCTEERRLCMGQFICLHSSDKDSKEIWLNADAIISVIDERPVHSWTGVYTFAGAGLEYHVKETVESVIGLIEQQTNPFDNYVCPTPVPASWSLSKEKEE
jgi:hypothetical protein